MGWSPFRQTGLTFSLPAKVLTGYTLIHPLGGVDTLLLDMQGRVVKRWHQEDIRPGYCRLLENGNLLQLGNDRVRPSGAAPGTPEWRALPIEQRVRVLGANATFIREIDWRGDVVWEYRDPLIHHDFWRLENGNTVLVRWRDMDPERAARVEGGHGNLPAGETLLGDEFIEIDPSGNVVWRAVLDELLDPVADPLSPMSHRAEWTHVNSVAVWQRGGEDKLLFSSRNTNRVGIIDRASGELVWKLTEPAIFGQHHPTWLTNGNVQVFDNGLNRPGLPFSRVIEIDPRAEKNEPVWHYRADPPQEFFSAHISGAERQPNGNVLICEGAAGRVFEITPRGEYVWEWVSPFLNRVLPDAQGHWIFRAHRYRPDYPGLGELEVDTRFNELHGLG